MLVGFSGAFRRSELVALDVADIEETDDGFALRDQCQQIVKRTAVGKNGARCDTRSGSSALARAQNGPIFVAPS